MLKSLWRLRHFIYPYRVRWLSGIIAFGFARGFEVMVPVLTAVAINRVAEGNFDVTMPVLGIIGAVVMRYGVVTFARYSVRKTGLNVAFDLRQRLYDGLQDQGAEFFSKYTITYLFAVSQWHFGFFTYHYTACPPNSNS